MHPQHHITDRDALKTAFFGMMVLAVGMGIGRFLYTPMLPVLLSEGHFSFTQLSWIASVNYAGYLVGSLLFSFSLFHLPGRSTAMLLSSAIATGLLLFAMALFTQPAVIMLVRFLAGIASAGMLIFGSTIVLRHTRNPFVIASLFSGVGIGIALGNEYVIAGLNGALSSRALWTGAGIFSVLPILLLALLLPSRTDAHTPAPLATPQQHPMRWWLLAVLYGLAGFGYIIVATYLPLMAKNAGSPLLTIHLWTLVGLAIVPGCFGWLWAARRWGVLQSLTLNLVIQSLCVLLSIASSSPPLLILSSVGFGATFMGTVSLVMTLARQLSVPGNINLLGFVTLTYGIGQILGPLLTSWLRGGTDAIVDATLCGAAALFCAAIISAMPLRQ
ncbi:MFS transporter [Citrobacter amalonaticus]|uniref:MFS transporter n=1 Tax=Citrobacter amalonaticus TaxID=35703 RepID=A0A2S4RXM6_CITAM|nr:MFS transporter [Citrobacter amalonaticus]POT56123.1 MFS transporter [Citrobacter amalonaticus]POT74432.1 MFS transporter [Citrobacter amalonaticus]POU65231.1 MFS transporter [Citrobacter amalonaticus]POV04066.1 MFS transporter [Citrobacter amalonaticus]